jgi:hypothetical protein
MSPKEIPSFDFADFWISYLNDPNGLKDKPNVLNEMDENLKLLDDEQSATFKG